MEHIKPTGKLNFFESVNFKKKWFVFFFLTLWLTYLPFLPGAFAVSPKDQFFRSQACYRKLQRNRAKQKYRHNWLTCIKEFQTAYRNDPDGPWAAAGLYMSGKLYKDLYRWSGKNSDRQEAVDIFNRIVNRFPKSRYRAKAQAELSRTVRKKKKTTAKKKIDYYRPEPYVPEKSPSSPMPASGFQKAAAPDSVATIAALRYWSNPKYTRVVIDADQELAYTHQLLEKDPSENKPQRLVVDLARSRLDHGIQKKIPIHDDLLTDARAGQYRSDMVRVVVDIKSFNRYNIFSLNNPFRIVMDVWGAGEKVTGEKPVPVTPKGAKVPKGALALQLSLGVRRIVIDPGHGGKDFGAPGYLKGVHEKDIVLKIARRLAKKLRKNSKYEVFLTRNSDRYLSLEERTAIANTKNADLFISIHTNASEDRRAYGIETYILNLATDEDAILVAARENAISKKNISDLETILNELMQNAKSQESIRLAAHVQESMHRNIRKGYRRIKNKGVKQAPFYVLLGAQMPSILIETAFISNSRECKRLVSGAYQERLADAIKTGIENYIEETNPTAFSQTGPGTG